MNDFPLFGYIAAYTLLTICVTIIAWRIFNLYEIDEETLLEAEPDKMPEDDVVSLAVRHLRGEMISPPRLETLSRDETFFVRELYKYPGRADVILGPTVWIHPAGSPKSFECSREVFDKLIRLNYIEGYWGEDFYFSGGRVMFNPGATDVAPTPKGHINIPGYPKEFVSEDVAEAEREAEKAELLALLSTPKQG